MNKTQTKRYIFLIVSNNSLILPITNILLWMLLKESHKKWLIKPNNKGNMNIFKDMNRR
jgi:hypothetical protein